MKVEATHNECQYMAIHGKKPDSLIEREKLAKSNSVRKLIKVRDDLLGIPIDRVVAARRLKQLLTEKELIELEQDLIDEKERSNREYPFHKGNGWYELSNGKTVRGEQEAIESEIKIIKTQ